MHKKVDKGAGVIVAAQPLPGPPEKRQKARHDGPHTLGCAPHTNPSWLPTRMAALHVLFSPPVSVRMPDTLDRAVATFERRRAMVLPPPCFCSTQTATINTPPTRVLLMRNMVGPGEVDEDLEEEARVGSPHRRLLSNIAEEGTRVVPCEHLCSCTETPSLRCSRSAQVAKECEKYGPVVRCLIFEVRTATGSAALAVSALLATYLLDHCSGHLLPAFVVRFFTCADFTNAMLCRSRTPIVQRRRP